MQLRKAGVKDSAVISSIARRTWPVTYAEIISEEQISYMLDSMYAQDTLHEQIIDPAYHFHIISTDQDAGFICFGPKEDEPDICRIHKLYVLPDQHAKGLGTALLDTAEDFARMEKKSILELNVNIKNPAFHFYIKQGFTVFLKETLPFGPYVMDDYRMRKIL